MEFEADPDYKFLRGLLTTVLEKQKCQYDFHYDWLTEKPNINDEIAIERYIKNNTDISFEMPNEDKKEKDDDNKIIDGEKENNMNMDKYSGLKTEITSNDDKNNKNKNYTKENCKTDGDIKNNDDNDNKNESKNSDKKDKKSKDKKNKKCNIF